MSYYSQELINLVTSEVQKERNAKRQKRILLKRWGKFFLVCGLMYLVAKMLQPPHKQVVALLSDSVPNANEVCEIFEQESKEDSFMFTHDMMNQILTSNSRKIIECYFTTSLPKESKAYRSREELIQSLFQSENLPYIESLLIAGISPNFQLTKEKRKLKALVFRELGVVEEIVRVKKELPFANSRNSGSRYKYVDEKISYPIREYIDYPHFLDTEEDIKRYVKDIGENYNVVFRWKKFETSIKPIVYALKKKNKAYIKLLLRFGSDTDFLYNSGNNFRRIRSMPPDIKLLFLNHSSHITDIERYLLIDDVKNFLNSIIYDEWKDRLPDLLSLLIRYDSKNIFKYLFNEEVLLPKEESWVYLLHAYEADSIGIFEFLLESDLNLDVLVSRADLDKRYHIKESLSGILIRLKSGDFSNNEDKNNQLHRLSDFIIDLAIKDNKLVFQNLIESRLYQWKTVHKLSADGELAHLKRLIRENPKLLNLPDAFGHTPIMLAIKFRREKIVAWLLENGADTEAETTDGKRALHFSIDSKFLSGGKQLLRMGAGVTTSRQPNCASIAEYAISRYVPYKYAETMSRRFDKRKAKEIYFSNLALKDLSRELVTESVNQGLGQCATQSERSSQ